MLLSIRQLLTATLLVLISSCGGSDTGLPRSGASLDDFPAADAEGTLRLEADCAFLDAPDASYSLLLPSKAQRTDAGIRVDGTDYATGTAVLLGGGEIPASAVDDLLAKGDRSCLSEPVWLVSELVTR